MGIVQDYISHGLSLVPIAPNGKKPTMINWQTRAGILADETLLPVGWGVGLMHAYSGTMALDIDDWERTRARGINVDMLYAAPDSVTILSGKPGHGKLLYRMPMGLRLPSKQFYDEIGRDANGKIIKKAVVDFRCGTLDDMTVQDVLPPSIHPDTNLPYQWGGNGHWTRLPTLPAFLLDYWMAALKDSRTASVDGVDSSWDEIRAALSHINPDCSREEWVSAGMALQWAGEQTLNSDQALAIWDGWSKQGTKYPGERAILTQWKSFRSEKETPITLGTLFRLASENGWTRPAIDASSLFADKSKIVAPADLINTLKPAPPDIDLSLWPDLLAKRAQEVSDTVGCDPIVPLWAGLAAVCGVVDARSRLELMDGFKVPPVLWLMTVGDPGDRKSPGSRPMLSPLKNIEASDRPRYAQDKMRFEVQQKAYVAAYAARIKFMEAPEQSMLGSVDDAPNVPPEPKDPVPLKITVSDITSQELVKKAQSRPRGFLCYLDEMNSWADKLTNRLSGENRSAWVVAFESEHYEMDRVNNGSTYCENFAVSIYGNMQPQVLEEKFTDLGRDGLLQRFLPAVLRHNKTRIGQPIPEFLTSAVQWENTLRLTYALEPKTYRLSPDAFASFRHFQVWYEDQMHNERLMNSSNEFITAFGKITGLVGRLALVFHTIEAPYSDMVSVELMERVIKIARGYIVPTYRHVFDRDGSMSAFDAWIMEYIIQYADKPNITLADINGSARRPFEKANIHNVWSRREWIISAMYLLEKMQWVARIDDGSKEGKGIAEWLINPHLKTMYADYRTAVVRAKYERNQDRLEKAGSSRPNDTHGAEILDCV